MFLPSVPPLLALAAQLEAERDHVLADPVRGEDGLFDEHLLDAANRVQTCATGGGQFRAVDASGHLDRVIYAGAEHGTIASSGSEGERTWLTLPGLLDSGDLAEAVRSRARRSLRAPGSSWSGAAAEPAVPVPLHRQVSAARRELHRLVGAVNHRTGAAHGEVHARLRSACGGPPAAAATLEQLEERIATARDWL